MPTESPCSGTVGRSSMSKPLGQKTSMLSCQKFTYIPSSQYSKVSSSRTSSKPTGHVDLLLGIHEARLFLTQVLQSWDNLLLCQSIFGSGLLLTGHHPHINPGVVFQSQHVFEKGQAMYCKRIHHVITKPRGGEVREVLVPADTLKKAEAPDVVPGRAICHEGAIGQPPHQVFYFS